VPAFQPFVSCLLPTRDRPAFVRQAIQCFLRQTYDQSELIVLDDGDVSVAKLCFGLSRVLYVPLKRPTSIGNKLNRGVQLARGSVIQKLDDDDYYHPEFLRCAVEHLHGGDGGSLLAWDCFLVLLASTGENRLRFSGHGWQAGGTLCFNREVWERARFRDLSMAEDWWFIHDHALNLVRVCEPALYILVRHGQNTWSDLSSGVAVDRQLQDLPVYPKALDEVIPPVDLAFYRALIRACVRDVRTLEGTAR
jgi:glycosyltransferase involved in cell wall biosynthesis